jgi:hypothetical protein
MSCAFGSPQVQLQHVLAQALAFVQEANELLQSSDVEHSLTKVEALYATGSSLGLNLPQCSALEKISKRMRWLTDLDEVDESSLDLDDIQSYLDLARQNDVPADHAFVKVLEDRLASGLVWKRSAEALLQVSSCRPHQFLCSYAKVNGGCFCLLRLCSQTPR